MASDLSDPAAIATEAGAGVGAGAISFAVDSISQDADGRVELTGRWYGIRGRRFVRPTLTAALEAGGERRALADLAHKPWAGEDGEAWTAAFPLGLALKDAAELELNVAPDISIPLGPEIAARRTGKSGGQAGGSAGAKTGGKSGGKRTTAEPDRGRPSPGARAPRVRGNPPARPVLADRVQELERLRGRLADLEAAHDRERRRREQAEKNLEDERTEALRLRSEVGRLGAELDLAAATRSELDLASAQLESTRGEAVATERELQSTRHTADETGRQLKSAREQARDSGRALESARSEVQAHERRLHEARHQLEEVEREREAVNFALDQERAETERLRRELADAEDSVRRLAGTRSSTVSRARPMAAPGSAGSSDGAQGGFSPATGPDEPAEAPGETAFQSYPATDDRLEPMSPRLRALNKLEGSTPPWADRPLNPSLRSSSNWLVRGLAVVVVLIVLVAILLVINSTVA